METPPPPRRNAFVQRAIEALLQWEGVAKNDRLREILGVHYTSASRQLAQYVRDHPDGIRYSTTGRCWITDDGYVPAGGPISLDDYLSLTRPTQQEPAAIFQTRFDLGNTVPAAFASIYRAITEELGVTAMHMSMRNPVPTIKIFYPHALVEAGRRWHVRAYVPAANRFEDLAMTRLDDVRLILGFKRSDAPDSEPSLDKAWQTHEDLRLLPHPDLSAEQKRVLRAEYFQKKLAWVRPVRAALLSYVIQDLRAAINPAVQRPPDYQLCVDSPAKLKKWLMPGEL